MPPPDSVQEAEVNLMADTPLTDLFTVHPSFLHFRIQISKHPFVPFGVLRGNNRKFQPLDIEMKSLQSFFTKPQNLSCRFHVPDKFLLSPYDFLSLVRFVRFCQQSL